MSSRFHSRSRRGFSPLNRQSGAVLLIVLWTSALMTILVTAMAGRVKLAATSVLNYNSAAENAARVMTTLYSAEAEIMLELMPRPIGEILETNSEGEIRNPAHRFDGRILTPNYPIPSNMELRVFSHAGKINLNRIPRRNMQLLIEKRLGGQDADPEKVQSLLDAWTDWTDLNDLPGLDGAESEYYLELDPPFSPRNNPELDTVEEISHIRGFAELFVGLNLDAAFTVYGNNRTVNLNLATREAMLLLPGLNSELADEIIAYRLRDDINTRSELGEIVPFENLAELSTWVGNETSSFYSVFVSMRNEINSVQDVMLERAAEGKFDPLSYNTNFEEYLSDDKYFRDIMSETFLDGSAVNQGLVYDRQAYMEIIEVNNFNQLPRVYKVDPYGRLPTVLVLSSEFN